MEKKIRLKSKRKVSQTRQVSSSRKTELQKPLTIKKGKGLMTNNKKTTTNEKSYNSETKRRYCCLEERRKKNHLLKQLLKEKKSFRRRLFSHCESRKSLTTMIDLIVLINSEKKLCSVYCDECLRRCFSRYFFGLVATAADLVTLPDDAAFFSTSLITPTATV
jgi:hypothetical protein